MRVPVTGASGHVGTNLTRRLIEQGHRVDAFDRAPSPISTRPSGAKMLSSPSTLHRLDERVRSRREIRA